MKTKFLLLAALALSTAYVNAQSTTAFTFQGSLDSGGAAVNGTYDLQIAVVDGQSNLIAGPVTNLVNITNGLFSASLDFGSAPFTDGPRYLQVGVRTNGTGAFTELSPLQQITASPFSIAAISLTSPLPATNLSGTVPFASLPSTLVTNLPAGLITNGQSGVTLTGTLSGNGAGLSNVAAASLTGFLPAAQISGTLPAVQISGTLTTAQLPSTLVTNSAANVSLGGLFNGVFLGTGAGLTNINAANLVGAVSSNALTAVPAANLKGVVSLANLPESLVTNLPAGLITNEQTNVTLSGMFIGDGSELTNLPIPSGLLTNGQTGLTLGGTFTGNGVGLTGISAGSLSGTIGLNQLPSGPNGVVINGESSVNLSGTFNGTFSGNGSSLNSINAGALAGSLPANVLTTTPIPAGNLSGAIPAGVTFQGGVPAGLLTGNDGPVPSSVINGTYSQQVNFSNPGNTFAGTINATINTTAIDVDYINNDFNLTNGGNVFITNSTLVNLQVTNGPAHTGVLIDNNGNITATGGIITGNGSGLTGVKSSALTGPISAAMIPSVNGSAITGPLPTAPSTIPAGALFGTIPSAPTVEIPAGALFGAIADPTVTIPGADIIGTIPDGSIPNPYTQALTFSGPVDFTDPSSTFAGTFTGTIASTGIDVQHINNSGNLTNDSDVFITNNTLVDLQVTNGPAHTGVLIDNSGNIVSKGGSFALTNGTSTGVVMDVGGDIWATGNLNVKTGSTITGNLIGNVSGDLTGTINGTPVNGASSLNIVNDLVLRDGSGNFSAGTITAGSFSGPGTGLTGVPATSLTGQLAAGLTGPLPAAVTIDGLTPTQVGTEIANGATEVANIISTFQFGSQTLSNLVPNPSMLVNGVPSATLPIITGPSTNAGGFWITNGTLFVTNATLAEGAIIHGGNLNTGNAEFTGTVTAGSFVGDGSGLTGITAASLTGAIPNGAIPPVYSAAVTFTAIGNTFIGSFTGDGSGLTSLSAGNLTGALPATVTIDGLTPLQAGTELANIISDFQFGSQTLSNLVPNPSMLVNGVPSATLPIITGPSTNAGGFWITNGILFVTNETLALGAVIHGGNTSTGNAEFSGAVTVGSITGNGSGLTSLPASALTGLIPQTAIPSPYNGTVNFDGIGNSFTGTFTGGFSGNGSGLFGLTAADLTGTIPQTAIPSPYTSAVTFNNGGNSFTGNGNGLTSLNAANLSGALPAAVTIGAGAFTPTQVGAAVAIVNSATPADTASDLVKRDAGGNIAISGLASTSITNVGNITNSGNITNAGNIFITNDVFVEFFVTNGVNPSGVVIDNDGDITSVGGDLVVTNAGSTGVLINSAGVQADQFVGNVALSPADVSAAPGAGSTASATIVGTEASGQITLAGTAGAIGTELLSVSFPNPYPTAAYVVISPANQAAAGLTGLWVTGDSGSAPTATGFEIQLIGGAPGAGTYLFNYVVIGK